MIKLNILMNTNMEEILAFKCCALPNQNLEVHVINETDKPVVMKSQFFLVNDTETIKIENIYPPFQQTIQAKDIGAFYCTMDESLWEKYHSFQMKDIDGNVYQESITDD